MYTHKKLIIWTLITNFLIIVAGGHGIGVLGLMEAYIFSSLFNQNISKPIIEIWPLILSAVITFLGQLTLLISFFTKPTLLLNLKIIGVLVLITGYIFLLIYLWTEPTIGASIITAIPFLILASITLFKNLKSKKVERV